MAFSILNELSHPGSFRIRLQEGQVEKSFHLRAATRLISSLSREVYGMNTCNIFKNCKSKISKVHNKGNIIKNFRTRINNIRQLTEICRASSWTSLPVNYRYYYWFTASCHLCLSLCCVLYSVHTSLIPCCVRRAMLKQLAWEKGSTFGTAK
jgi:hypothetical protein